MAYTKEDWKRVNDAVAAIEAEREALLEPTKARYDAACREREDILDVLSDQGDYVGQCEDCMEPIFSNEKYDCGEVCLCEKCAPTFEDMQKRPSDFVSLQTGDPLTQAEADSIVAAHLASGGKITDSTAR